MTQLSYDWAGHRQNVKAHPYLMPLLNALPCTSKMLGFSTAEDHISCRNYPRQGAGIGSCSRRCLTCS